MATKLKDLLAEVFEDQKPVNKHVVIENVAQYGNIGKPLYGGNIIEIAQQLVGIAESAQNHILSETDEWFDKVSVNRNMKSLKGMVKEFKGAANEYHTLNQRLTALYEDMGTILNRYYDIQEADQGDMDHDNKDEPDDEEYLQNKRAAIDKAIAKQ